MTTRDHLRVLSRRRWVLLAVLGACIAGAGAWLVVAVPQYEARAELLVIDERPGSAVLSAAAPLLSMLGEPAAGLAGGSQATQMQLVTSRPALEGAYGLMHERPELLERVASAGMTDELFEALPDELAALGPQPPPSRWPERYEELLDALEVGRVEDSELIEVRCRARDARLARDFVNAVVLAYVGEGLADARSAARRTRRYVEDQIAQVEQRLAEAETSLRRFGERAGTIALDEQARQQVGLVARLGEQAEIARSTARARRELQEELMGELDAMDRRVVRAVITQRNPEISELQVALAEAEAERMALLEEYAAESLPVRRATASVQELRGRLRAASEEIVGSREETLNPVAQEIVQEMIIAQGEALAAQRSMEVLEDAIGRIERGLGDLPAEQVRLLRLQREIELLERFYLALEEKRQEYEITEQTAAPASQLVEQAIIADEPAQPRPMLTVAAALVAGTLLGLLAVGLTEHLDERLHDAQMAADELGVPVVATLGGRWREQEPDDVSRETLAALLARVDALQASELPRGAVFISAEDCGERVTVAEAVARVASRDGRRTLVLAGTEPGLAEAVAGAGWGELSFPLARAGMGAGARVEPDAAREALEASGVELVVAHAASEAGLVRAVPLARLGYPLFVVVALGRTTGDARRRVVRLARDSGVEPAGAIATGAAGSTSRYHPPRTEGHR